MSTVIRSPNWIGDGIMCLPALRAYKEFFPEERLVVVAKRYLADIFLNIPEIDEIVAIPNHWTVRSYFGCLRELRKKRCQRGILFTNSFASALFFRLAGIHSCDGYDRDGRGWLLGEKVPRADRMEHHQYFYLQIVEHLAGKKIAMVPLPRLVISGAEKKWATEWLAEQSIGAGQPILAVSPTAAYGDAKAWLPERFRAVIQQWQKNNPQVAVLLLGGPAEKNKIAAVASELPGRILNLAGCLTLRQTIVILAHCRLFIGNDSGLMHIAAALGVPLAAIFGPTEPGRTAPLTGRFRLLHHGADCAPCRRRECPTDHRCMSAVSVEQVLAAMAELWRDGAPETK
jgi:heptosyltransferase-2